MSELGREEQQRIRTEHRVHKISRRNQLRRARQAKRDAAAEAKVRSGRLAGVGRGASRVGRGLKGVGMAGASMLGIGAGFAGADAFSHEMDLDQKLRVLAIQTRGAQLSRQKQGGLRPGETLMGLGERTQQLRGVVTSTAIQKGVGSSELAGGVAKWQELTGRGDLGSSIAPMIADFSQVFGAEMDDVASVAAFTFARVRKEIDPLTGSVISTESAMQKTRKVMDNIGAQGQQGMIEFGSLASVMGKLTSATAGVQGKTEDVIAEYVALAQLSVEGGASNAAEATTALMRFRSDAIKLANKEGFKELNKTLPESQKVDPYVRDEKTGARTGLVNPLTLLKQIAIATKGDLPTMAKLMGARAMKVMDPVITDMVTLGGGDIVKGISLQEKKFNRLSKAGYDKGEWSKAKALAQGGSKAKGVSFIERLRNELGPAMIDAFEKMLPAMLKLSENLPTLVAAFASVVEFFANNPFTGLGTLVGAFVLKELAIAGIGQAIAGTLGPMGKLGFAAGAAALAWMAVYEQIQTWKKEEDAKKKDLGGEREDLLKNAENLGGKSVIRKKGDFRERLAAGLLGGEATFEDLFAEEEELTRDPKTGKVNRRNVWKTSPILKFLATGTTKPLAGGDPVSVPFMEDGKDLMRQRTPEQKAAAAASLSAMNDAAAKALTDAGSMLAKTGLGKAATALGKSAAALGKAAGAMSGADPGRGNGPTPVPGESF